MSKTVSAILLSAGRSQRMGSPKQLLPLGKRRVIHHCLDNIGKAGITDTIVVLRQEDCETVKYIEEYPVQVAYNTDKQSDMAESIRTGLKGIAKTLL